MHHHQSITGPTGIDTTRQIGEHHPAILGDIGMDIAFDHYPPSVAGGKTHRIQTPIRIVPVRPARSRIFDDDYTRKQFAKSDLPCARPTHHAPGTVGKVDVMAARTEAGLPRFHPDDATAHDDFAEMDADNEWDEDDLDEWDDERCE